MTSESQDVVDFLGVSEAANERCSLKTSQMLGIYFLARPATNEKWSHRYFVNILLKLKAYLTLNSWDLGRAICKVPLQITASDFVWRIYVTSPNKIYTTQFFQHESLTQF